MARQGLVSWVAIQKQNSESGKAGKFAEAVSQNAISGEIIIVFCARAPYCFSCCDCFLILDWFELLGRRETLLGLAKTCSTFSVLMV